MDITSYKKIDHDAYVELYQYSLANPQDFWDQLANQYLDWFEKYTKVYTGDFKSLAGVADPEKNKWFINGKINACYNCLDRHLPKHSNKIAYYWQGDEIDHQVKVTYQELFDQVNKFSNVLLELGLKKGDAVCIYMPLSIEGIAAMLACARIGLVHTVVFAGFSATALAQRILDADCKLLITTDMCKRGGKDLPLWQYAQETLDIINNSNESNNSSDSSCYSKIKSCFKSVLLVPNFYSNKQNISKIQHPNFDICDFDKLSKSVASNCPVVWMDAEDPLFILYTSGSTGKPKGVVHTTAGYLLHAVTSFKYIFDIQDSDVYWSTADIGWVAGHSYVVYGVLGNAVTSVIFSGVLNYPDFEIFWKIIDKYQVSIFYTAPTAIRSLMQEGEAHLESSSRKSLRLLGSVGEPINPEAWQWYYQYVGEQRCPIVDTWWQTETGATMLSPIVSSLSGKDPKPGCARQPFFGIELAILDDANAEITGNPTGNLVIKRPWPGMLRTLNKDHEKFIEVYLKPYKNYFYTGDIACRDKDGDYWLQGRSDDVLNIAGHRFGTAEIESALLTHPQVAESAVVAMPDPIKGQVLMAYVVLKGNVVVDNKSKINLVNNTAANSKANPTQTKSSEANDPIKQALVQHVRKEIGPIAILKTIRFVSGLPKTRSGKIMRRILKKIAYNEVTSIADVGDVSTLTNPEIINELLNHGS